jgi:hypothetical protein
MCIRGNEIQRLAVGIVLGFVSARTIKGRSSSPHVLWSVHGLCCGAATHNRTRQASSSESSLYDAYGVHPKYITEMENRDEVMRCLLFVLAETKNSLSPYTLWVRSSFLLLILCAKYEHRTVSCALSNSYTSPFRTVFLFDSITPSSLRLLLSVCACTDPHVPPTKIISLIFHPLFSPTASPATFSRLLTRTSCWARARASPRSR